MMVILY